MPFPKASLAYQRLTFGPRLSDHAIPTDANVGAWLSAQLAANAHETAPVASALAAVRLAITQSINGVTQPTQYLPLTSLYADTPSLWLAAKAASNLSDFALQIRPAQEIQAASYVRAALSPNQLFEVMADFWHTHFNVNAMNSGIVAAMFPQLDQIVRANAFGNFHAMLVAVAQSASMMYYLNQVQSTGAHPNENFAREVMELHTLGAARYLGLTTPNGQAGTGYSDEDVIAAARILSGWTLDPATGVFTFNARIHSTGAKMFMGRQIPSGGRDEGDTMLAMLAVHPGTANTIATKLYKRFIGDAPPANSSIIAKMSQTFLANVNSGNQIALVLWDLVQSAEFAASTGQKFKTPFEFVVSLLRSVDVSFDPTATLNYLLSGAGDPRFQWAPPNGRPDVATPWISNGSLLHRFNAAETILSTGAKILRDHGDGLFDAMLRASPSGPVDLVNASQAATRVIAHMLPQPVSPSTAQAINAYAAAPALLGLASVFRNQTTLRNRLGLLIAAAAATPEFQFRG